VRLIAPAYVKPFGKPKKNYAADAKAICEAAQRRSMRFVPVKSERAAGKRHRVPIPGIFWPVSAPNASTLCAGTCCDPATSSNRALQCCSTVAFVEDLQSSLPGRMLTRKPGTHEHLRRDGRSSAGSALRKPAA
jgi:hypothetical protein